MFVEAVMDSLEEFFDAISVPTAKYISDAFKISLLFVVMSFAFERFNIWTFVCFPEAATCSILLGLISLIDSATRSSVKSTANRMKTVAAGGVSRLKELQNRQVISEAESADEVSEVLSEEEEMPYGDEQ